MGQQTENSLRYRNYINSPEWKAKRDQRMKIDHCTCCVCGKPATEVHHLTYDHLGDEPMDDLVSLCHQCHYKAGEIADPKKTPWTLYMQNKAEVGEDNFMASMRADAENISKIVFDYLMEVRGSDFESLWVLRQETEKGKMDYWSVLRNAVNALCRFRYSKDMEDRKDISMRMISSRTIEKICLAAIEHNNRNFIQGKLGDCFNEMHKNLGSNKAIAEQLGISQTAVSNLRKENGTGSGPTLRETVLYYCGLDAVAGIKPMKGFSCLTDKDYEMLNSMADYMVEATGEEFLSESGGEF